MNTFNSSLQSNRPSSSFGSLSNAPTHLRPLQKRPQPLRKIQNHYLHHHPLSQSSQNYSNSKNSCHSEYRGSPYFNKENCPIEKPKEFKKQYQTYSPVATHHHSPQLFYSPLQDSNKKSVKKCSNPSSFKLNLLKKNVKKVNQSQNGSVRKRSDSKSFTTPPVSFEPFIQHLHSEDSQESGKVDNNSEAKSKGRSYLAKNQIKVRKEANNNESNTKEVKWNLEQNEIKQVNNKRQQEQEFFNNEEPSYEQKVVFSNTFSTNSKEKLKEKWDKLQFSTVSGSFGVGKSKEKAKKGKSLNKIGNIMNRNSRPVSRDYKKANSQKKIAPKESIGQKSVKKDMDNIKDMGNEAPYPSLDIRDFEIGQLLGRGGQATARMALHKPTGAIFCLRIVPRKKVVENLSKFIEGLKIQMFLNHPNIVKVYGLVVEEDKVYMIMEYCPDGNLADNLRQIRKKYSEAQRAELLKLLSEGVKHLHEERVQHRDLKLENILMIEGLPKISDFELAVNVKFQFLKRKTICGSPVYFSPEMIANSRYNKKADIWCLGIIFYEILCGKFPFELKDAQDFSEITSGNMKPFPEELDPSAKDLLAAMLEVDSDERLDAESVLEHAYFESLGKQEIEEIEERK